MCLWTLKIQEEPCGVCFCVEELRNRGVRRGGRRQLNISAAYQLKGISTCLPVSHWRELCPFLMPAAGKVLNTVIGILLLLHRFKTDATWLAAPAVAMCRAGGSASETVTLRMSRLTLELAFLAGHVWL